MSKKSIQNSLSALLQVVWVVGVFLLISFGLNEAVYQLGSNELVAWLRQPLGSALYATLTYGLIAYIVIVPLRRMSWAKLIEYLGLKQFDGPRMFVWALFAWGLSMVIAVVTVWVLSVFNIPGLDLDQPQKIGFESGLAGFDYVMVFFILVILAPLAEELIFRGYLFKQLRGKTGFVASTVLTSMAFAGLHFQPNVVINVFILSILLCYLREKFDSVWPGVMVHALKNGLAYALIFVLPLYGIHLV